MTKRSMGLGALLGFMFSTLFALFDFGFRNVDFVSPLITAAVLGFLIVAWSFFGPLFGMTRGRPSSILAKFISGLVVFVVVFLLGIAFQSQGIAVFAAGGAGAVIGAVLLGSLANWVDLWRKQGFGQVMFRSILFLIGLLVGVFLVITLPLNDPSIPKNNWGLALVLSIFGLWLGWAMDGIKIWISRARNQ